MRLIVHLLAAGFVAIGGLASAHVGLDNSTEIRVFPDKMVVTVRMTPVLSWMILGDQAPDSDDDAAKEATRPLLIREAERLMEVTSGGAAWPLKGRDVVFEEEGDVAFLLEYDRPRQWPVKVRASFFRVLGELDSGTMEAYDQTSEASGEDPDPVAQKVIVTEDPGLSFSLINVTPAPIVTGESMKVSGWPRIGIQAGLLVVFIGGAWMIRNLLKR